MGLFRNLALGKIKGKPTQLGPFKGYRQGRWLICPEGTGDSHLYILEIIDPEPNPPEMYLFGATNVPRRANQFVKNTETGLAPSLAAMDADIALVNSAGEYVRPLGLSYGGKDCCERERNGCHAPACTNSKPVS